MSKKIKGLSGVAFYFACSIPLFYFNSKHLLVGGFGVMYYFVFALIYIFFAFWAFLINPKVETMAFLVKDGILVVSPHLLVLCLAPIIWVFNFAEFRHITRGLFMPIYEIIAVVMAIFVIYIFGRKGLIYQLAAIVFAGVILMAKLISEGGLSEFIREYGELLKTMSGTTGELMRKFESPCWAYGTGLYLVYFLFYREKKSDIVIIIACLVIFTMGLKRSTLLGLFLAIVITFFLRRIPESSLRRTVKFLMLFFVAAGFLYVACIYYNVYERLMDALGINTMGRVNAYDTMKAYYSFEPAYWGHGPGFSFYMISGGRIEGISSNYAGDIHNEFLRQYVELGMVGFILWLLCFFSGRAQSIMKGKSAKFCIFFAAAMGYCFGTFMSENIYYDFYFNLCFCVIILAAAFKDKELSEKGV